MQFLTRLFIAGILLLYTSIAFGQTEDTTKTNFVPFDTISKNLESIHHVKFFYDSKWFEGKLFLSGISKMSLPQAISIISRISQLSVSKIKDSYYVFTLNSKIFADNSDSTIYEIGDFINYGNQSIANIKGSITNAISNTPLIGAKIYVLDLNKKYDSNSSGKFSIIIPVGEHDLKFEYPGYDTKQIKVKLYSDGELPVELNVKTIMLNEVSVVATRIDQYYRRTKMSVLSIDAKSIKQLPTNLGEIDIVKSLSLLPGVQTTGEFGSGFNVRGGSADQNLILLEEVPVFNSAHFFGLTSIINPDIVSKVTLYKGAIPITYGERASSVLSVKMGSENSNKTKIMGGIGLINSRLNIDIPVSKKLKIIVGGRTSYSDWILKSLPDIELKNSSARFNDMNLYINYNPSKNDEFTLFTYASNDYFKLLGNSQYYYGNLLGSINYSHRFNSKFYSNLTVGTSYYKARNIENDSLTYTESYKIENSIIYNTLKYNLIYNYNDKHILTLGINGFLYDIDPGKIYPYGEKSNIQKHSTQREKGLEWAPYIGDDFEINKKISMEFGFRFSNFFYLGPRKVFLYDPSQPKSEETILDSVNYKKNEIIKHWSGLEPRFSFKYNISNSSSARFSYTRINQYINVISNTVVVSPTDYWKLSDNYIKPLISDQIALGYFKDFKNSLYETSVELYYKQYKHLIEYKNGAQISMNDHLQNELIEAKGESMGLEIYIKKNTGKVNGWISYTLSKSIRKTVSNNQAEQLNNNNWFPDNIDKPNNLVINGAYFINKRWKVGMTFNYSTGRPVTLPELKYNIKGTQVVYYSDRNKYRLPDYHRLDISISQFESLKIHKKWKGYWTISIINVYGRKNAYSVYYKRDKSPYSNYSQSSSLYKLYIIGRPLPTITYNFIF